MSLGNLIPDDDTPENACPECNETGKETDHWYFRCTTDDCDVKTYIL